MKKLISFLLCAAIALCSVFASNAVCAHSYTDEAEVSANCAERAHTLNTCTICGHTEKIYDPLYTAPDGCYFLMEGEISGDILNVSITLKNNPGFWANRLTLNYNPDALEVASTAKGDVWPATAAVTVNTDSTPPYVRFYGDDTALQNNTKNGLIFAVSFNIKGKMSDWGLALSGKSRDNINVDGKAVPFEIVDTVTLGYGDHVYDNGVITLEPTYLDEGEITFTCALCSHSKTEALPIKILPGDSNANGKYDSADILLIKYYLAGLQVNIISIERMDFNEDSRINAKDILLLKKKFLGYI